MNLYRQGLWPHMPAIGLHILLGINFCVFMPRAAAEDLAAPPADAAAIVVQVGETPIYRSEVNATLRRIGYEQMTTLDQQLRAQAEAIEQLVNQQLLRMFVTREAITVKKTDIEARLDRMRLELATRQVTLNDFLAQSGQDEQSMKNQIALDLAVSQLIVPKMTPQAIAATFVKHHRDIDGTRLRVSHILLRPDPGLGAESIPARVWRAKTIRREILQGEYSFADAAKKFSAGPSRRRDGDVGFLSRRGLAREEIAREVFSLAKGDISQPVTTPFGVHLFTVTGVDAGTANADSLRPQLEAILAKESVREVLAKARKIVNVSYAPDTPHFDPASTSEDIPQRTVILATE